MMSLRILLSASLAASGIAAQLLEFNESITCTADTTCPGAATAGYAFETSQHAYPNDPFYTVPSTFSEDLAPGLVLKLEEGTDLANYSVPSGLTLSRMLYTSSDLNGTVVPASAYILWPATLPLSPPGCSNTSSLSLVAWAHGTSGVFPACGPSNYKALQYHFMVPFALALQGMAVVAPDYTGLGIRSLPNGEPLPHAYMASPAHANDVANAVLAARAAFPDVLPADGPFVAAGHSQGGAVAWTFAERQAIQPVPGYRGTLAFAPPADAIAAINSANEAFANNVTGTWVLAARGFVQHSVIAGITAVYPSFNFTGMTDIVYDRFHNVMAKIQGCLPSDNIVFSDVPPAELGDPSWTSHPTALEFQRRTRASGKEVAGPFLVIAGGEDSAVRLETVQVAVNDTCAANSKSKAAIEFVTYEGQDHFPVIQASQTYWMQWIKDRLAGKSVKSKGSDGLCAKRTVKEFRTEFNKPSTPPNWLVTAVADPRLVWQYSL